MLALALLVLAAPPEPAPTAMKDALDALVTVTPWLSSPDAFRSPDNAAAISRSLDTLARLRHPFFTARSASPSAVAELFGRQAAFAQADFASNNTERARYRVRSLSQVCLGCHLRSSKRSFVDLEGKVAQLQLPPLQQAELFATTRQFDKAIALWRTELVKPVKAETDLLEQLDGLRLAVRVAVQSRDDAKLARELIGAQLRRPEVPAFVARELASWDKDVIEWQRERFVVASQPPAALMSRARALIEDAGAAKTVAPVTDRFVALLRAASALDEALRQAPDGPHRGEALWLLGVVHASLGDAPLWQLEWLYLEGCVRENPGTPRAVECAKRLRERVHYSWRTVADVPPDVFKRLGDLAAIANEKAGATP
ncbi:MAG: hypothetical protein U0228_39080 [Myxococcaceae bacterium]